MVGSGRAYTGVSKFFFFQCDFVGLVLFCTPGGITFYSVCYVVLCSLLGTEVEQVSPFFCTPVSDLSFGRNTVLLNVSLPFGLEDDDAVRSES